ncbi:MAG: ribosomal RNA small subunit methyltransferase A [Phototrophicales bacterium]|nr:MAG: ribosomal RNA small subunit methyltransferase A [Phototrophicales bacterium]
MTNPKALLDQHDIQPRKSLGQNFLHDPNALEKIVATAEIRPGELAVEVGAGTGALTEALARTADQVIAYEIDGRLIPILSERFRAVPNVRIIHEDFLAAYLPAIVGEDDPYVVVANVPYYITSAIIRHVLEAPRRPRRMVLTVQFEVAERLIAKPGRTEMSLLSVSAQYYTQPQIVTRFKPAVFYPRPDVDSAVVRLDSHPTPPVDVPDDQTFFEVARAGFSQKRKQLRNSLADGLRISAERAVELLNAAGVDPRRRPETLTLEEWASIARAWAGR